MSLDVYGFIDPDFEARPQGGVVLNIPGLGDYSGPGGTWQESPPRSIKLHNVAIHPLSMKEAQFSDVGGTISIRDARVVHINDGTSIYPDDTGRFAHTLQFDDGQGVQTWRVRSADNRPWRNFCRVIVERYREDA